MTGETHFDFMFWLKIKNIQENINWFNKISKLNTNVVTRRGIYILYNIYINISSDMSYVISFFGWPMTENSGWVGECNHTCCMNIKNVIVSWIFRVFEARYFFIKSSSKIFLLKWHWTYSYTQTLQILCQVDDAHIQYKMSKTFGCKIA